MKKKKIFIKTWGCQMNTYDSSIIANILQKNNYKISSQEKNADIFVLNTCSIRNKAQEKLFHQLGRWKKIKEKNKNIIIAVGGCVAVQEGKKIFDRAPYINIIFGTQNVHQLPILIEKYIKSKLSILEINNLKTEKFNFYDNKKIFKTKEIVSIMEGCNKFCSFCIVPYTRGREISRNYKSIISEIMILAQNGVKEITLLGQNVNAYNFLKKNGKKVYFSKLLRYISEISQIKRIKFITSHPCEFTEDIIEVYKDIPKIVSFLHLPVQSGSNKILQLMKRRYNVNQYKEIISKLIKYRNNIQISSDFIIGFPGETKEDFQKTMKLISEINFDMSFSFLYSPRPGTPASKMKDNVSLEEKKERLYILQEKINEQTLSWSKKMLYTKQMVLVDGPSKKNIMQLSGKTENNRTVHFKGSKKHIGKIVPIKIIETSRYNLQGKLI
ncbi:tRNA (N6-isopentenyl adenosine(37)-C2)-methylthiotransferase MiaB [Buchnera aphidicola (Kurisakia onigurumii)]|uniref:tRNA (N6-isopentenyl adenosine(37)-C2)-methylthiotransferase MiaB n=1 Tax=Buchnera aphidicola TaxID=9 RepID=UPI0031B690B4